MYTNKKYFNKVKKNKNIVDNIPKQKFFSNGKQKIENNIMEGSFPLIFEGKGKELFSILAKNLLLNIVTLGIYYPWR